VKAVRTDVCTGPASAGLFVCGYAKSMKYVTFHVPADAALLAAFGKVAIRHAQLDYALRMLIKTLAGLAVEEAMFALAKEGSAELRRIARKLARSRLGYGTKELLQVHALLKQCELLTERRNELMHATCAKELNLEALANEEREPTEAFMLSETLERRELPTAEDLTKLANAMGAMVDELNEERLHGFIAEALHARRELSSTEGA